MGAADKQLLLLGQAGQRPSVPMAGDPGWGGGTGRHREQGAEPATPQAVHSLNVPALEPRDLSRGALSLGCFRKKKEGGLTLFGDNFMSRMGEGTWRGRRGCCSRVGPSWEPQPSSGIQGWQRAGTPGCLPGPSSTCSRWAGPRSVGQGCVVRPLCSSPALTHLGDADLLQADHLGATAHPTGQPNLQDFTIICERCRRRSSQGLEPPEPAGPSAMQAARW